MDRRRRFLARLADLLRAFFPAAARTGALQLAAEIDPLVTRAERYGLKTEQGIVSFVLAAAALGADFDRGEEIADYLSADRPVAEKGRFLDALILASDKV
jgi:hypothetical protein